MYLMTIRVDDEGRSLAPLKAFCEGLYFNTLSYATITYRVAEPIEGGDWREFQRKEKFNNFLKEYASYVSFNTNCYFTIEKIEG